MEDEYVSGAAPGLTRHIYPQNYACSADNSLDKAMLSHSPPIDADYPLAPVTDTAHTVRTAQETSL